MLLDPREEPALDRYRGVVCSGTSPVWRSASPTSAFGFPGPGLFQLWGARAALPLQERLLTALVVNETEAGGDLQDFASLVITICVDML